LLSQKRSLQKRDDPQAVLATFLISFIEAVGLTTKNFVAPALPRSILPKN
tara:strand:- start:298 stop:447 length:150 start_codon:yes stop_codon:yes gene_type:complete